MKKRNYFLLAAVACVSGLNLFLSINGQNLSSGLKLLTVEAIANAEYNPNAPLNQQYSYYGCIVIIKEIWGEDENGGPIYNNVSYPGKGANCVDGMQRCTPYSCTKLAQ